VELVAGRAETATTLVRAAMMVEKRIMAIVVGCGVLCGVMIMNVSPSSLLFIVTAAVKNEIDCCAISINIGLQFLLFRIMALECWAR
jgi:hypothetical protein